MAARLREYPPARPSVVLTRPVDVLASVPAIALSRVRTSAPSLLRASLVRRRPGVAARLREYREARNMQRDEIQSPRQPASLDLVSALEQRVLVGECGGALLLSLVRCGGRLLCAGGAQANVREIHELDLL